ncbi:MAG: polyhydroxyalkanoate synthesis regulator DNA-binding domain-containing protein [Desulfofustis sp.]|jgi:polyhydroxyalkanoate synthesis repressor PhaR
MTKPILFKKYANRRLYNTSDSKYMTLEEIAELIRQGRQIEVIDAKTKGDVTAFILTQIVLEQAKNKNTLLPVPLLHLIIRFGDNVLVDFFENHLQQVIGNYVEYKQTMDTQFQRWLDLSRNLTETAQESMKAINPFQAYFGPRRKHEKSDDEEK